MEAVELDLWDYFRVDVLDLFRGSLSPRRVVLLLRALPEESNTGKRLVEVRENERNRATIAKLKERQAARRKLRVVDCG